MKKRIFSLVMVVALCLALMGALCACIQWPNLEGLYDPPSSGDESNGTQQSVGGSGSNKTIYDVTVPTDDSKPSDSSLADMIERVHSQVVEIYVSDSTSTSAGAGTFIAKQGNDYLILTCMHVVEGAETNSVSIRVRTTDGNEYPAVFLGGVPDNDIAVIRIQSQIEQNIATVRAINSDTARLRVGEDAIAIGNPLGTLGGSVSKGIISAINRNMTVENYSMNLLQVDTSINGGNSGGGLFDLDGKLIGVVNAKIADEEVEGIGFAIPVSDAISIANDIIATTGHSETGYLGYKIGKTMLGISTIWQNNQLKVYSVSDPYGSAYGILRDNDVITAIEGSTPSSSESLRLILAQKSVGDTLNLTVKRNGSTVNITITLKQYIYGYRHA